MKIQLVEGLGNILVDMEEMSNKEFKAEYGMTKQQFKDMMNPSVVTPDLKTRLVAYLRASNITVCADGYLEASEYHIKRVVHEFETRNKCKVSLEWRKVEGENRCYLRSVQLNNNGGE